MHFHAGIEKKDAYISELEPSNESVSEAVPASKFPQCMVRHATAREKLTERQVCANYSACLWRVGSPVSSRRVCLVLNPRIAAAEISVRRLARTSEGTSMRCSSRPLIVASPIWSVSFLTGGTMTFLKRGYTATVRT